jgi:hypothetical protein
VFLKLTLKKMRWMPEVINSELFMGVLMGNREWFVPEPNHQANGWNYAEQHRIGRNTVAQKVTGPG